MKYSVQLVRYTTIAVEANDDDEAYEKASAWFKTNIDPNGAEDGDVMPWEDWTVNQYEIRDAEEVEE